jgi:hypothetical protein
MPTAINIAPSRTGIADADGDIFAIIKSLDFVLITGFAAIGLLVTIGLATLVPLSNGWLALLGTS